MTSRATPHDQQDPSVGGNDTAAFDALLTRATGEAEPRVETPTTPQPPYQPRTRREARELAARAGQEARDRGARAWTAAGDTVTAPAAQAATAPAPAAAPAQAAPAQAVPAQPAPAQPAAPVRERGHGNERGREHGHEHEDLAWLRAAAHHPDDRGGRGGRGGKPPKPRKHGRGRRALTGIVSTFVILGLIGGGAAFAWNTFQPQVKSVLQRFHPAPTDYTGDGTGTVDVTINQGDTGSTIAATLAKAGVTLTPGAFYQLLLETKPDPVFQPGVYQLHKHMSAASALTLLQDPKSRLEHTLLIREGDRESTILQNAATATGIPLAQLQAAASKPAQYGLPPQAKTLEGFLFPATYDFNPGMTAQQVVTALVNRSKQAFQDDGVPTDPDKLWNTVILASIVQAEAGPNPADLPKIAGVFQNRLNQNMALESDATVTYGLGKFAVFTSDAQRADASNPYNTYVHKGLTPGPIGNPGDAALQAALHPQGDYLYFTVVNLQTGETAFSQTIEQQNANVAKLQAWCQVPANKSYCA